MIQVILKLSSAEGGDQSHSEWPEGEQSKIRKEITVLSLEGLPEMNVSES